MAEKEFGGKHKPAHSFTLNGHKFRVHAGYSITFLRAEEDKKKAPLDTTIDFIRGLIVKEDRPAFDRLLTDPEEHIEGMDLVDIANWLVEVMSGRPTQSPASSGNGAGRTGTQSKAKSTGRAGGTGKK